MNAWLHEACGVGTRKRRRQGDGRKRMSESKRRWRDRWRDRMSKIEAEKR
jgi:hypothetical protein